MAENTYKVTLLSDVVATADAATVGGHQGLDYLPGSLFLGAAVAQSQREENKFDPAFFLSGRVRFLDGLPLANGKPSLPIPRCFHQIKGKPWDGCRPWNPLNDAAPGKGEQPQQLPGGYMTSDGTVIKVPMDSRMKTAIDREQRRSEEGQLFGYESIASSTDFYMRVQADSEADLQRVDAWLAGHEVRLGRSRSAEYGVARLAKIEGERPAAPCPMDGVAVLYLASDLSLVRDGMPVLLPVGADFGIDGAEFLPEKSFLRTRRYTPWNAFFNCRMTERQVLCKGSVLAFRPAVPCDLAALQFRLAAGVGMHREEGLGQILVNPPWLLRPPPLRHGESESGGDRHSSDPKTSLTSYLDLKARRRQDSDEAFHNGLQWAKDWFALSQKIAKKDDQKVPSKSQWATIRELAIRAESKPDTLLAKVKAFCGEGLRRKLWSEAGIRRQGRTETLLAAIEEKVGRTPTHLACLSLYHAAVEMGRKLSQQDEPRGGNQS